MWTRPLLKQNAKSALAGKFWLCFGVSLVALLLGSSSSGLTFRFSNNDFHSSSSYGYGYSGHSAAVSLLAVLVMLVCGLLALAFLAFVSGPINVGLCRFMMENRSGNPPFGTLFSAFHKPYQNVVVVQLLTTLKIFLGYCLLVIPGIVWQYQYMQVPYLLAENPYMPVGRAMELSRQMMEGEKWNTFVLQISFFGWFFLGALFFGIGELFVMPYFNATMAELYAALRAKAFANGLAGADELGGFVTY